MATTYTLISSITVGSGGAASIEFTSIPATYTDLIVKFSSRTNRANLADVISLSFNGSTSNRSVRDIYGTGASVVSSNQSNMFAGYTTAATTTASTFGNAEIYIPNYTSSNNKSSSQDSVSENNSVDSYTNLAANLWSDSNAITSITLTPIYGTLFVQYSTAYLYGISNA